MELVQKKYVNLVKILRIYEQSSKMVSEIEQNLLNNTTFPSGPFFDTLWVSL